MIITFHKIFVGRRSISTTGLLTAKIRSINPWKLMVLYAGITLIH